jgi:S-adenosylmethionine decarboxylase
MRKLAPNITRQRFLIEGFYKVSDVNENVIKDFFSDITDKLNLRIYGQPTIFSPGGEGKKENQGYDAFVPLIDSGISLYVWTNEKFLSVVIYTCKCFNDEVALEFTKEFWELIEFESKSF